MAKYSTGRGSFRRTRYAKNPRNFGPKGHRVGFKAAYADWVKIAKKLGIKV